MHSDGSINEVIIGRLTSEQEQNNEGREEEGKGHEVLTHFIAVKRSGQVSYNLGHGMCMSTHMKYTRDMVSLSAQDIQEYILNEGHAKYLVNLHQ